MSVESNSGSFVFTLLHLVKKTRATLSANQNKTRRNHDLLLRVLICCQRHFPFLLAVLLTVVLVL